MEKKTPLLTVKPVFDPGLAMMESLPACAAGTVVSVFLGATLIVLLLGALGLGNLIGAGSVYSTFFVLGLAATPALYFEAKKAAYRRTVFHFHADYLEYQDFRFFLNRRRGRVRLRDIDDVLERTSFLQSRRGLSSVYLVIPSFPQRLQGPLPGLKIPDVPDQAGLRDKIIDLIEASDRRAAETPQDQRAEA
jgi:hypothetical protein